MVELSNTLNQLAENVNALKDAGYDTTNAGRGNKAVGAASAMNERPLAGSARPSMNNRNWVEVTGK